MALRLLVLDASASCHMPVSLKCLIAPPLRDGLKRKKNITWTFFQYRLTGDIIGDYSFENPVEVEIRLYFEDMAKSTPLLKIIPLTGLDFKFVCDG